MKDEAMYRIREVDSQDEEIVEVLDELHRATFIDSAPVPPFDEGHWWLAFRGSVPVAFAGMVQSTHVPKAGYLCRVGVINRDWPLAAVAFAASGGTACVPEWLAKHRLRHH